MEIFSIGSIVPFVEVLRMDDVLFKRSMIKLNVYDFLSTVDVIKLKIILVILFCGVIIISSVLRLYLLKISSKLSFESGAELSSTILNNVLRRDYIMSLESNTSEQISNVLLKSNSLVYGCIYPLVNIIQASTLSVFILFSLFYFNIFLTTLLLTTFLLLYFFIHRRTKNYLDTNAKDISKGQTDTIQTLRETFGSYRDVVLNQNYSFFVSKYSKADLQVRLAQGSNAYISSFPKYIVELVALLFVALILVYSLFIHKSIENVVIVIVVIAFASQRLLPSVQVIFSSLAAINGNWDSIMDSANLLTKRVSSKEVCNSTNIRHEKKIELRNISFTYPHSNEPTLRNVNMEISRGQIVGIFGMTGSGKSTLIDLIASLLKPTSGSLCVDGIEINTTNNLLWRNNFSYLSQVNYFLDSTIWENVAFGCDKLNVDFSRVEEALKISHLSDVIKSKGGLDYCIGENGTNLSGGQRQRLAIARQLYKQSDLILFDEGTNALDSHTESMVFGLLKGLKHKPTVIFVSHNLRHKEYCDIVYEVKDSSVFRF